MQNRFAAYAPVVFWVGVVVLIFGVILTVGGGRGPIPTPYMLVGGAALVVLSGLLNITASRRLMGQRSVRYGSNALVMTLAFLAILGLINFVGTRRTWRQDFTANQQFSLSLQTIRILEGLKQPVKATAFYTPDIPTQEAQDRLKEYALHSAQFTYEFVNPNEHPETAIKLGATRAGGIVFESGGKKQEATAVTESDFTGAILKVTSDKPRVVVFLTGHKERDLNGFGDDGYSTMRASLEKDNYSVSTQSLLISNTIPLSATVVVLAGPQSALSDSESQTLSNYLDQGGHLLVMA
ncbi:MAG: GldG family protein, partial [Chloroflexi bacterium]|nr:GldG family protein [Chloroflexota bacterium]